MNLTIRDIVSASGGRLLCGSPDKKITDIITDSRHAADGCLFVPLKGGHTDAHVFIDQVFDAGAAATLTSEHEEPDAGYTERAWIRVDDNLKALQAIGAYARNRLTIPLIGVTGSVGKTTTREMIALALSAKYKVFKTAGNHNSQVGVPITLTQIPPDDDIGVIEMGVSIPGEMERIAAIARVDSAVVTNISSVHIEQMGSKETIMQEKLRIQDGFHEGSILFVNGDDELLKDVKAVNGAETVTFGPGDENLYHAENLRLKSGGSTFTAVCRGKNVEVSLNAPGLHNVTNALAALAVADAYGTDLNAAAEKLSFFCGFENRQRICEYKGITVIDDSYNASPDSMRAALSVLTCREDAFRKIAVLADMKELGPESHRYHEEIGEWLACHPIDILFTLGEDALYIEKAARKGNGAGEYYHFSEDERSALTEKLLGMVREGDCVLLKGSNSMRLEEVAKKLLPYEE